MAFVIIYNGDFRMLTTLVDTGTILFLFAVEAFENKTGIQILGVTNSLKSINNIA